MKEHGKNKERFEMGVRGRQKNFRIFGERKITKI